MPKYLYTAKSYSGETKGGEMVAKDEKSLVQQLRSDGFILTSVKLHEEKDNSIQVNFFDRFKKVPLKEKLIFARNLSVMITSGLTLSRAIDNLTIQTSNKTFKNVLTDIKEELQGGKTLSEGLAKYPGIFSELFINMVRVGEAGGNLDEVLKIVSIQLEKENDLISKVKGAMIYPAVIIVAMIGIAILMLTYVLPQIMGVFKDMDVELPASTQLIIKMSDVFQSHGILIGIGFVIFIFLSKVFFSTPSGKRFLSFVTLHVPAVRNIVIKVNCARFARIYSSLLRSGISVIEALRIISDTLSNSYYKDAFSYSIDQIQKGVNLSDVLKEYEKIFPPLVYQIVEVGEETGKTESVLLELAQFYEDEVSQITKNMSSIIEPVLMILIGGSVGFFAISMLQPMYSLMDNIQ